MYKVLIVEDEMLVRLGLKNLMDWQSYHMSVIADVSNGQAAWALYEKEKPEIVITDLKMPVMNGMELIEKIREKDKSTKIVILSCLKEFELVQKAMSLGVSDYILKLSMAEEDIGKVLFKLQGELDKENAGSKSGDVAAANQLDAVKEELIKDFIIYRSMSPEQFAESIRKLNLRLEPRNLMLCVMELDQYDGLQEKFKDADGKLIRRSLSNVLDELLSGLKRGEAFFYNNNRYVLLFSFPEIPARQAMHKEMLTVLNHLRNFIRKYFDTSVTFGTSASADGYDSLEALYKEAAGALEKKYIKGAETILFHEPEDLQSIVRDKIDNLNRIQGLGQLLGDGRYAEYQTKIAAFLAKKPKSPSDCKKLLYQLVEWIGFPARNMGAESGGQIQPVLQRIQQGDTLDGDIAVFLLHISELIKNAREQKPMSAEIAGAVKFMQGNYTRELSLQDVSSHISLSPGYLSNLFKKELNINFVEYLNGLRIEKAKALLIGTYLKSYEISEKVGFTDNTYFSKVFKKVTGVGPNEFRRTFIRDWSEAKGHEDH